MEAARRPAWIDVLYAAAGGAGLGMATFDRLALRLVGLAAIVVGFVAISAADRRRRLRHGRIVDGRSMRSNALRFGVGWVAAYLILILRPDDRAQPWFAIGAGLVIAVAAFIYLRWDERSQMRRLATGDYDRHDLI